MVMSAAVIATRITVVAARGSTAGAASFPWRCVGTWWGGMLGFRLLPMAAFSFVNEVDICVAECCCWTLIAVRRLWLRMSEPSLGISAVSASSRTAGTCEVLDPERRRRFGLSRRIVLGRRIYSFQRFWVELHSTHLPLRWQLDFACWRDTTHTFRSPPLCKTHSFYWVQHRYLSYLPPRRMREYCRLSALRAGSMWGGSQCVLLRSGGQAGMKFHSSAISAWTAASLATYFYCLWDPACPEMAHVVVLAGLE